VGARLNETVPFLEKLYQEGFIINTPDGKRRVFFSIGVTNLIADDTLETALERADFSMYWCKQNKCLKPVRV